MISSCWFQFNSFTSNYNKGSSVYMWELREKEKEVHLKKLKLPFLNDLMLYP